MTGQPVELVAGERAVRRPRLSRTVEKNQDDKRRLRPDGHEGPGAAVDLDAVVRHKFLLFRAHTATLNVDIVSRSSKRERRGEDQ